MQIIPQQFSIFILIGLIYSAVTLVIANRLANSKSERTRQLWKFVVIDCVLFLVSILALTIVLPQTLLTVISWIGYSLIFTYVISIEVPGYIKLLKFDEKVLTILKSVRKNLVKMGYSSYSIDSLNNIVEKNKNLLEQEQIEYLLSDYIELSERIRNVDKSMWDLTLNEVTANITRISSRSKHPFPKLIDVLSLAGLSFLIAQLLDLVL